MPNPTIVRQIETLLASGRFGNDQRTLETYRVYLTQLADMAETGDFEAAAELDEDYGIQVGRITWQEGGVSLPAPTPSPTAGQNWWEQLPVIGGLFGSAEKPPQNLKPLPPGLSVPPSGVPPDSWPPPGTQEFVAPNGTRYLFSVPPVDEEGKPIFYDILSGKPTVQKVLEMPPSRAGGPVEPAVYFDVLTGQRILYNPKTGAKIETLVAPKPSAPVAPTAPVAPYYGAPTEREKAQTEDEARKAALAEAKYRLDVAEFQAKQPKLPLRATTNPDNPDEDNQRREWMRARVANGENPYDYGAFARHMAGIGAPAAPSYEGFFEVANYEKSYQAKQDTLAEAERGYQQRLTEIAAGQALTQYQAGQLGLSAGQLALSQKTQAEGQALRERQQQWSEFGTTLEAAKTGQPLTYLSLLRGEVPGAGGGEIYQGLRPVVPSLALSAPGGAGAGGVAEGYTEAQIARARRGLRLAGWPEWETANPQQLVSKYLQIAQPDEFSRELQSVKTAPTGSGLTDNALGGGAAAYTPAQMARVRRGLQLAGWPQVGTANDTEAVQAYLRTAVPDEFSRQLQAASSSGLTYGGAPAMPPAMATISRGEYLPSPSWPAGALRLPGVQAQANETPTERLARYEALAYQGIPSRDIEDFERRIRLSVGPGLAAGAYQPSPLRLR